MAIVWPDALRATLETSWRNKTEANNNLAWELGFKGGKIDMPFPALLAQLESSGHGQILLDIYNRSVPFGGLWSNIYEILTYWNYEAGHQVSQGLKFTTKSHDAFRVFMRANTGFCEDDPTTTVHGDKDCFRELIKGGPGLHVCITRPASLAKEDHDIHIDKFQVVCSRKSGGMCDYSYANAQFAHHMWDAGTWYVGDKAKELWKKLPDLPTPPRFPPPSRFPKL